MDFQLLSAPTMDIANYTVNMANLSAKISEISQIAGGDSAIDQYGAWKSHENGTSKVQNR